MYAKIFRTLWDGTLAEHWEGWSVLVFLLAHCDRDGIVDMTLKAIARRSGMPPEAVSRGIGVLESPDPESRSEVEEGRRLVRLSDKRSWGWRIVNHEQYRDLVDADTIREQNRARQQARRDRLATESRDESRPVTDHHDGSRHTDTETDTETRPNTETSGAPEGAPVLELGVVADPSQVFRSQVVEATTLLQDARAAPLVKLPTNRRGVEYPVGQLMVDEWAELYPAADVLSELRTMRGWLLSHKSRRKTWGGMPAFITRWLSKAQNGGGAQKRTGHRVGSDRRYTEQNFDQEQDGKSDAANG